MSLLMIGVLMAAAGPAAAGGGAHPMLVEMNETLAAMGMDVRVAYAEYITSGEGGEAGQTIYANNRGNKQLGSDWVPGDPNRGGRTDITWIVDTWDRCLDVPVADMLGAIERAMGTWQEVICSEIPLTGVGAYDFDLGYVQYLVGFGGTPGIAGDITQAGWLPGAFFDLIGGPGGSASILGVTFTFIWVDAGVPTDLDGNGKSDVAFREIYYNDAFDWNIDATFDIETVVLHETGHGLSQAHFGKIYRDAGAGGLHFSPRAVMNAAYSGVQQELTGTDVGGHCSNWGSWPNE
jgi:hypothetical protein